MQGNEESPNIIFLMADQMRWDALEVEDAGIKTPHLGGLARQGIRFTEAVCNAPMCLPSRYSMMTGLYPSQLGVRHNTQMCPTDEEMPVPALAELLRRNGYQTAGFGKMHWYIGGVDSDIPTRTSRRGFEIRAEARGRDDLSNEEGAEIYAVENPAEWQRLKNDKTGFGLGEETIKGYLGHTSTVESRWHREGWLTGKAVDFLQHQRDARPLFLYLSFDFPHAGFNVPPGYEELYDIDDFEDSLTEKNKDLADHVKPWRFAEEWKALTSLERRRIRLRYYALCSYVDDLFGVVLNELKRHGELGNSLIVFCSDHGEMLGERARLSKYSMHESSVRVPLILAGSFISSKLETGEDTRPAALIDILPTILAAAGVEIPAILAGEDLLRPALRKGAFAEMHGSGYQDLQRAPVYMWRSGGWKVILSLPGFLDDMTGRTGETFGELYDLSSDPAELNNLYDNPQYLAVRERLTRELLIYLACTWARYPRQPARPSLSGNQRSNE